MLLALSLRVQDWDKRSYFNRTPYFCYSRFLDTNLKVILRLYCIFSELWVKQTNKSWLLLEAKTVSRNL